MDVEAEEEVALAAAMTVAVSAATAGTTVAAELEAPAPAAAGPLVAVISSSWERGSVTCGGGGVEGFIFDVFPVKMEG